MTNPTIFYQIAPRMFGLERLDISDDWSTVRDLVQHDLASLDDAVAGRARVRPGSNSGGGAHLFVYRVYEVPVEADIDPVVVGILIRPSLTSRADGFVVTGDIAGELKGDILFEAEPREVIGWTAMTEAAREISSNLVGQAAVVSRALGDANRQG